MSGDHANLASYRRAADRIAGQWPEFLAKRTERLKQHDRFGPAVEKVAENIIEDLFTEVLDWAIGDLNNQVGRSDLLLTRVGIKHLLVEVKRPGALVWNQRAMDTALAQAREYADKQLVKSIAISDGTVLYAVDIANGAARPRARVWLDAQSAPMDLWWLFQDGIYRVPPPCNDEPPFFRTPLQECIDSDGGAPNRLHPKYKISANCFAYVGNANDPLTWKLPCCHEDGSADLSRLPKAIQAILTNYRGEHISTIPEKAIPDVLVRLARLAKAARRMPVQEHGSTSIYGHLNDALAQLGRLKDIEAP